VKFASLTPTVFFQQNSALAHRVHQTVQLLRSEKPKFTAPNMWLTNSLGIKPADYCIWRVTQKRFFQAPIEDAADLQQVMSTSAGFQLSAVDEAVDRWQKDSMPVFVHKEVTSNTALT